MLEFFFCFFVNGNYLRIFTSNRNGIYLIWFCNVFAYFVYCIRYHRKKSCCLIKIYLKCFIFREIIESKFWRISKERNMTGNKIISLQEFLKKKITYIKLSSHWKNRYIYSIWNYFFRIKNNLHPLRCSLIINTFLIAVLFNKNYSTYHQKHFLSKTIKRLAYIDTIKHHPSYPKSQSDPSICPRSIYLLVAWQFSRIALLANFISKAGDRLAANKRDNEHSPWSNFEGSHSI